MLLLKRNKGERIVIEYPSGDKVIVEIQKTRPSKVVIGTDAPEHIEVFRKELFEQSILRGW